MAYVKKMPILLSLIAVIGLCLLYIMQKRPLSQVFQNILIVGVLFFVIGTFVRSNALYLVNEMEKAKKIEDNLPKKEGNDDELKNTVDEASKVDPA